MNKVLVAPSILSADFSKLGAEVSSVTQAGADWIHVDVMDGHFVPNLTIGPVVVKSIRQKTKLPFDVHLMNTNPDQYLEDFANAGADIITVHQEACAHLHRTLSRIKELKKKAGVSINPATPAETLMEILPLADLVLVMSVNPGFGGQKFIRESLKKIKLLAEWRRRQKLNFLIEVDGGVSTENASELVKAGCDVLVAGSAVFKGEDYQKNISALRKNKK